MPAKDWSAVQHNDVKKSRQARHTDIHLLAMLLSQLQAADIASDTPYVTANVRMVSCSEKKRQAKQTGRRRGDDSDADDSADEYRPVQAADPFFVPEADPFKDPFFQVWTPLPALCPVLGPYMGFHHRNAEHTTRQQSWTAYACASCLCMWQLYMHLQTLFNLAGVHEWVTA